MSRVAECHNPAAAWRRAMDPSTPLHALTWLIAKTVFQESHQRSWETAVKDDQWLAVGAWMTAEAVVLILPLNVKVNSNTKEESA